METKKKQGRPSSYSDDIANTICVRLAKGESLRSICRDPAMPVRQTVVTWLLNPEHKSFLDHYETARKLGYSEMFEELTEIADDTTGETQRDRLRVDTRKWYLSKVAPKIYGDKLDFTSGGEKLGTFTNEQLDAIFKRRSASSDPSGME
jgi:hypothetical protein